MSPRAFNAALAVALLTSAVGARAFERDHLPLNARELATRLRLTAVQGDDTTWLERPLNIPAVGVGGVTTRGEDYNLVIRGRDRTQDEWTAALEYFGMGTALWRRDLDKNGIEDLIITGFTGGCGLAPAMHVLTIMFDEAGRPVPWAADGYFEQDSHGLRDVLDLDADGHAEIVRMSYDDGYWMTSVFEAQGARWVQLRGPHAGRVLPVYTRFTLRPNHEPVSPAPGRFPFEDQLSNVVDSDAPNGRIIALRRWSHEGNDDPSLVMADGRECVLDEWSATASVVLDTSAGRDIAFLSAGDASRELVAKAVRLGLDVSVTGQRRRLRYLSVEKRATAGTPPCVPEQVWIQQREP